LAAAVLVVLVLVLFPAVTAFKVAILFFLPLLQPAVAEDQEFLLDHLAVTVDQAVAVYLGTHRLAVLETHQALPQAKAIMVLQAITMELFVLAVVVAALVPMVAKVAAAMELHHQ